MRPVVPSFYSPEPFDAWAQEKAPAGRPRGAWFAPGGFQAYEHHWALPSAIEFHQKIGPARITARIHELNKQMKDGLARMPHVELYTPRDESFSAGMVCFDVKGMQSSEVVNRLLQQKIVGSTTPYAVPYARLACGITNTPQEVEKTLRAIRALA
jgi:selenocysteine lyase/cysteine desulfurase